MARCSAAVRTVTNLPTAARGPGVFAAAAHGIRLREVGAFNTTTTAVAVGLLICTASGTQVGGLTEVCEDDPGYTPQGTAFTSQSTDSTGTLARNASVGAAIGAGVIWTFGDNGLFRPAGTGNGVIITCPNGTAQHLDIYLLWDE